jgi:hypothetical protein
LAFAKAKAGSKAQQNTPLEEKRKPQQNNIGKTNLKDPRVLIMFQRLFDSRQISRISYFV